MNIYLKIGLAILVPLILSLVAAYFYRKRAIRALERQLQDERREEIRVYEEQIKKLDGEVTKKKDKYEEELRDYNNTYRKPNKPDDDGGGPSAA